MTAGGGRRTGIDGARRCFSAGDLARADAICREILKRSKRNLDALELRGVIAVKRFELDEALKHFRQCLALRPGESRFHFLVGKVEAMQGRFSEALPRFERALELRAGDRDASEWRAMILEWDGDYDGARATLAPFVAEGTETAVMAEVQAKVEIHDRQYERAVEILQRHLGGELDPDDRHRLGHLAGSACEKNGDYDDAFEAHRAANTAVAQPFDAEGFVTLIDRLLEVFSRETLERLPRPAAPSDVPVFIAGMPRSGTTLVEQIIDAHPQAAGAGEIGDMQNTANAMQTEIGSLDPYPECVRDLAAEDVESLAGRYLDRMTRIGPAAARVVNKSLDNWMTLGLVAVLFPSATIIHCRRDPRDTCVSCYMSNILPQRYPYVTDLGHLGLAYRQYERLMSHWTQVLDLRVLDVTYEGLVDDLEADARRIIEFCGLAWDDRCLRFHASGRVVKTLSYDQVRQPIYRSSIARHKRFERHLGPLLEALAAGPG
jgi:Flp pilus assembly protein TadD